MRMILVVAIAVTAACGGGELEGAGEYGVCDGAPLEWASAQCELPCARAAFGYSGDANSHRDTFVCSATDAVGQSILCENNFAPFSADPIVVGRIDGHLGCCAQQGDTTRWYECDPSSEPCYRQSDGSCVPVDD